LDTVDRGDQQAGEHVEVEVGPGAAVPLHVHDACPDGGAQCAISVREVRPCRVPRFGGGGGHRDVESHQPRDTHVVSHCAHDRFERIDGVFGRGRRLAVTFVDDGEEEFLARAE